MTIFLKIFNLILEVIREETSRLRAERAALLPIDWFDGIKLSFKGYMSMIDGAALNYITYNVTHWRCSFCHLLPREIALIRNGIWRVNQFCIDELCLSILHFPLRMGDHLLKIAYSQHFKKARVCGLRNKKLFELRKKWVQKRFREDKDLLVDVPLTKGGNSNCGNLWR